MRRDPPRLAGPQPALGVDTVLHAALRALSGLARGLIYDVPRDQAPRYVSGSPVYLDGSPAWRRFLHDRERLDDGRLTVVFSLRRLPATERRLAIDWGNTYANAFVLVEPSAGVDLTDRRSAARRMLDSVSHHGTAAGSAVSDAAVRQLRQWYGTWVCWGADGDAIDADEVELPLTDGEEPLRAILHRAMERRYPPAAFSRTFSYLLAREPELFSGHTIEQARMPFLTRLGLPVLHTPGAVTRAIRAAINTGELWAYHRDSGIALHGPEQPVPDAWPDELVERLVL